MRYLIKRNLLLFFRDKAAVFFYLLGVLLIIGLYILFLGEVMKDSVDGTEGVAYLMDTWLMAGIIAVTPITTSLGALGSMVEDQKLKIYKDFFASPIKRSGLAGGYIISSFIISLIMTLIALILGELYIVINGGDLLSWTGLVQVLGIIIFYNFTSIFIIYFLVSFFRSSNAFSAAATIVGTLIGFLTGIYIPIGNLPDAVQVVVKLIPPSHAAMLLRQIMTGEAEQKVFEGASATVIEDFQIAMGTIFQMGDLTVQWWHSLLYLLVIGILFFALSLWKMSLKK